MLLTVLHRLRDDGNTVVVIEHNLDVIKTADWVIDLGPEGGDGGGQIIATGTPEDVAATTGSYTGWYLAPLLGLKPVTPSGGTVAADKPHRKENTPVQAVPNTVKNAAQTTAVATNKRAPPKAKPAPSKRKAAVR